MKKNYLLIVLLFVAHVSAFAQLRVESNGHAIVGNKLNYSSMNLGLESGLTSSSQSGMSDVGVFGRVVHTGSNGYSYGVYGISSNGTGYGNYGVVGGLENCTYGAGVMGTTNFTVNMGLSGKYAGYFNGATRVYGTLTANTIVQSSDYRLKENIVPLSESRSNILDKVLNMNVVEYNYRKIIPSMVLSDSVSVDDVMKKAGVNPDKRHIGLIAQELQILFPNLVEEDQDGYLAVNYVELVPVLVQAIQELQEEVDELKGTSTTRKSPEATDIRSIRTNGNILYQNTPNPFKEQTVIRFKLAENVQNAAICIYDLQGKQLKKVVVSSEEDSISFNGYELGEGLYFYSLIVNGQEIDTKKMIISK